MSDDELSDAAEGNRIPFSAACGSNRGGNLFPLAIEQPRQFASDRIALVGEAAHVLPPIGAQGLNMGLRDAADIADIVREAHWLRARIPARRSVLKRYDSARRADVVEPHLRRSISPTARCCSDFLPMQSLRAAGLHLIGSIGPLRRLAMREGLAPSWRTSRPNAPVTETPAARSE